MSYRSIIQNVVILLVHYILVNSGIWWLSLINIIIINAMLLIYKRNFENALVLFIMFIVADVITMSDFAKSSFIFFVVLLINSTIFDRVLYTIIKSDYLEIIINFILYFFVMYFFDASIILFASMINILIYFISTIFIRSKNWKFTY